MKLAACYTVFNGLELLEDSIESIRPMVDKVIVCYQTTSNKGETRKEVETFCKVLKNVELLPFEPDLSLNTKANERSKHQIMVEFSAKLGCTHFVLMACDHFYRSSEFRWAKKEIEKHGYDATFSKMYTYYKHENWRLDPIEDYFCPFINEIKPCTRVEYQRNYHEHVDPSVMLTGVTNPYSFNRNELMLHHYSMVRIDIEDKFRNAAASIRWNKEQVERFKEEFKNAKLGDSISYFQGRKLVLTST
jgi:hypothetical protein